MKKLYTLITLLIFMASASFAQSLSVSAEPGTTFITSNQAVDIGITVENISTRNLDIKAARVVNDLAADHTNYYCWDYCYDDDTDNSVGSLNIPGGGSNDLFKMTFKPNGTDGTSNVTMRFFDAANPMDMVEYTFVVEVSGATSIEDGLDISNAISNPYPNPAHDRAFVDYNLPLSADKAYLNVLDLVGNKIQQVELNDFSGKASINTENMPQGVYFVYLNVDGKSTTSRKFIVTK